MATANRVRISSVIESTLGTTPNTPRMRDARYASEALAYNPEYLDSDEVRSDRMLNDPVKVMQSSAGTVNGELSYPVDGSPLSVDLSSAFCAAWTKTPCRYNDGTADSVITDINLGTQVVTVTTGAAFVASQLVRFSGFTNAANNGTFKCTTGSATAPAFVGAGLVADSAPAAQARMKVCGFVGASGDIVAAADGLTSTVLDFTTLGLQVYSYIKVGGTAAGDKFATAANEGWGRITAVTANKITMDNLPSGWGVDTGTGKTIKVWIGDFIKNGTSIISQTLEKGFLDQVTPTYIAYTGMVVNTMDINLKSKAKVTYSFNYMGMGGSVSTTPLDASTDAATTVQVMAGNANVGRIGEAGVTLASGNWAQEFTLQINNNFRQLDAVDSTSPVDMQFGQSTVTGKLTAFFGSKALLDKFYAGTPSSLSSRVSKNNQALIFDVPRAIYRGGGNPVVTGKNTDIMVPLDYQASYDSVSGAQVSLTALEYGEFTS